MIFHMASDEGIVKGKVWDEVPALVIETGSYHPRTNRRKLRKVLKETIGVPERLLKQAMKELGWNDPNRRGVTSAWLRYEAQACELRNYLMVQDIQPPNITPTVRQLMDSGKWDLKLTGYVTSVISKRNFPRDKELLELLTSRVPVLKFYTT